MFLNAHLALAAAALAALYLHNSTDLWVPPTVYLCIAVGLQILVGVIRFGHVLYRNVKSGRQLSRVDVRQIVFKFEQSSDPGRPDILLSDAVHVRVKLPRPWRPQAGQYVYLCVPGLSRRSLAQLHPFYIAWHDHDNGDDSAVLIVQKHRGFTTRLVSAHGKEMKALIEGPFRKELNLDSYGTVLLFATGIGIAGQLPYITQLLLGYHNCKVKTRRIVLYWQVDAESTCL